MWVYEAEVEVLHCACWEVFVGESEAVHGWLELFDDVVDCEVVFEGVLDDDAEEFRFLGLDELDVVDAELDVRESSRVKDRVFRFCRVRDEVVGVEVADEIGEFCLCDLFEVCDVVRCDYECCIVCVCVHCAPLDSF